MERHLVYRRDQRHQPSGLGTQEWSVRKLHQAYGLVRLVYFESFQDVKRAIDREKQLKGWVRKRKLELIEKENSDWRDLSTDWFDGGKLDSSLRSE